MNEPGDWIAPRCRSEPSTGTAPRHMSEPEVEKSTVSRERVVSAESTGSEERTAVAEGTDTVEWTQQARARQTMRSRLLLYRHDERQYPCLRAPRGHPSRAAVSYAALHSRTAQARRHSCCAPDRPSAVPRRRGPAECPQAVPLHANVAASPHEPGTASVRALANSPMDAGQGRRNAKGAALALHSRAVRALPLRLQLLPCVLHRREVFPGLLCPKKQEHPLTQTIIEMSLLTVASDQEPVKRG